jgi:hypothetical protein
VRAASREELDGLVKSSHAAVVAALARAQAAEAVADDAVAAAVTAEDEAQAAMAAMAATTAGAPAAPHPTYGTLLHDFGYKKVYAMPAVHLVSKDKVVGLVNVYP